MYPKVSKISSYISQFAPIFLSNIPVSLSDQSSQLKELISLANLRLVPSAIAVCKSSKFTYSPSIPA